MEIINALEAKNQFGQLLDMVQNHPVQINRHGRPIAYVMSKNEYEKLHKLQELSLEQAILKANQEEAQDDEYQEELDLWDATLGDGVK
jgi:prevent-host-death family protein